MAEKLYEYTNGTHVYMKMRLDDKRIEKIDVYLRNDGEHYVINRYWNGYLGFTRVHGKTRYNEAKNAEIKDRVSM